MNQGDMVGMQAQAGSGFASAGSSAALAAKWMPRLAVVVIILGLLCRLWSGLYAPLWFDETFTAEIASQTNIRDWLRWCLGELGGPVYYGLIFLWEKLAGDGDVALRLPSLAFSIATPLLILWRGHRDLRVRLIWAALTAVSVIGIESSMQARYYALLYMLASVQVILFIRLIDRPSLRSATLWTSVSSLMILTHYHATIICAVQGAAYLLLHRGRAVATWPALLPLLPVAGWMAMHLPFLSQFARPDIIWNKRLGMEALWVLPSLTTGLAWPGALLLTAMAASLIRDASATLRHRAPWPYGIGETALVASGMLSIAIVMGAGFITSTFSSRYLIAYIPALLIGIALSVRRMSPVAPVIGPMLMAALIGSAFSQLGAYIRQPTHNAFNLQEPSAWLAEQGVRKLVWMWDTPIAAVPDPDKHLAAIGGFFLRRAHHPVPVIVPPWPRTGDPNIVLTQAAGKRPGTAILWIYDRSNSGARGEVHPWRIPAIDPAWRCRDFGAGTGVVLACIR